MEEIAAGVTNINIAGDTQKKNRIQVSNTKKPLFFYVNLAKVLSFYFWGCYLYVCMFVLTDFSEIFDLLCLCFYICVANGNTDLRFDIADLRLRCLKCVQRYMQQHNEVELSALGMGNFSPHSFTLSILIMSCSCVLCTLLWGLRLTILIYIESRYIVSCLGFLLMYWMI